MSKIIFTVLFSLLVFNVKAHAFGMSCGDQAKLIADAITKAQTGEFYNEYKLELSDSTTVQGQNGQDPIRTYKYEARIPSNDDAMSIFITLTFSDSSAWNNLCALDDIEIRQAG